MRFKRVYIEVTNICNLDCSFCKRHHREFAVMPFNNFVHILNSIKEYSDYIYLHVKGEPLLHPEIDSFIKCAYDEGYKINLTTNATLLEKHLDITKYLRQINVSFHATNDAKIIETCKKIKDCIINYRIWNKDENEEAVFRIEKAYNIAPELIDENLKEGKDNFTIYKNVFISFANKFEWPELSSEAISKGLSHGYCHALKDQIAILVDGTVVPCCLDDEGAINLGNIFEEDFSKIIESERAKNIIDGFKNRVAVEKLCQNCSYKNRF